MLVTTLEITQRPRGLRSLDSHQGVVPGTHQWSNSEPLVLTYVAWTSGAAQSVMSV